MCVKKADRKPRKPRGKKTPKTPKKGGACGDLGWPCCDEYGPEGGKCPKGDTPLMCKDNVCVEKKSPCGDLGWRCCGDGDGEDGECQEVRTESKAAASTLSYKSFCADAFVGNAQHLLLLQHRVRVQIDASMRRTNRLQTRRLAFVGRQPGLQEGQVRGGA